MIWLAFIIALVVSFLLSGIESAVLSVSRVRVRHAADEGDARAARLLRLIEDRDALLGAVTVVNHLTSLAAFILITWRLVQALGGWGYATGFLIALPVFLIGLEVVPKTLFRRYPFRLLRHLLPLVTVASWFRAPFKVIRPAQNADTVAEPAARDDLKKLTASLAQQRLLSPAAAALIGRVIDFKRKKTADLMLPLDRVAAVPPDMPVAAAASLAAARGTSTLPVLDEKGALAGVLEILSLPARLPPDRLVRQHMHPAEEAAASASALQTLQRLRKRGRSLAVVRDASTGKATGLVADEDLLGPLLKKQ